MENKKTSLIVFSIVVALVGLVLILINLKRFSLDFPIAGIVAYSIFFILGISLLFFRFRWLAGDLKNDVRDGDWKLLVMQFGATIVYFIVMFLLIYILKGMTNDWRVVLMTISIPFSLSFIHIGIFGYKNEVLLGQLGLAAKRIVWYGETAKKLGIVLIIVGLLIMIGSVLLTLL